jgi:HEPN domain-containing protein
MKWDEQAKTLRRKAAQDEQAMAILLAAPSAPDEAIGFHAQQAVEKLLKALLSHRRIAFRRTHDLTELIDLLAANGVPVPPEIGEVRRLGPYAAAFRYDDIPVDSTEPVNREWVAACVDKARTWVDQLLSEPGGGR